MSIDWASQANRANAFCTPVMAGCPVASGAGPTRSYEVSTPANLTTPTCEHTIRFADRVPPLLAVDRGQTHITASKALPGRPTLRSYRGPVQPNPLVPHLRDLGTTIFAEMSALATATGAVNLGQGFPDTDGPAAVAQAAADAVALRTRQPVPTRPGHTGAASSHRRNTSAPSTASPWTPTTRCSSPPVPPRPSRPPCSRWSTRATRSWRSSRSTTPTPRPSRWPAGDSFRSDSRRPTLPSTSSDSAPPSMRAPGSSC